MFRVQAVDLDNQVRTKWLMDDIFFPSYSFWLKIYHDMLIKPELMDLKDLVVKFDDMNMIHNTNLQY